MMISSKLEVFAGKQVVDWEPGSGPLNPETTIYRVGLSYDEYDVTPRVLWTNKFAAFLSSPNVSDLTGLVVGLWNFAGEMDETKAQQMIDAIATAHNQLPNLTALFLGDIVVEESEISWIEQANVSPILQAYPALETFRIRGSNGLTFGEQRLSHMHLKELAIETGGLNPAIIHEVLQADLPALEHLELWLGTPNYGGDATLDDLAPLLSPSSQLFPRLRYLGLRDSEFANDLAAALTLTPLIERIRVLDLSLGLLDDQGARALLDCPAVRKLEKLDIHYHYCSADMVERLQALGIEVDASERQDPHRWGNGEEHRFVAVSE
jgi:hypothetical protein